jgi:hypothetical protein
MFFLTLSLPPALLLRSLRLVSRQSWGYARGAVAGGFALMAVSNTYFYMAIYPKGVPPAYEAAQGRFLATLGPSDRVRFVGNSWQPFYPALGGMMAPGVTVSELINPSRELPLAADPEHNLVFIFNNDETQYIPLIREYYPGGKLEQIQTPGGPSADVYRVPASQAFGARDQTQPTGQGLAVTTSGTPVEHHIDPFVGSGALGIVTISGTSALSPTLAARDADFVPLAPVGSGASRIRWESEVYAEGGPYVMELRTDGHALLEIDGAQVVKACGDIPFPGPEGVPIRGGFPPVTSTVELTPGWHQVRLDLDATGNANGLEWTWTRPNGVREIVPPSRLRHNFAWPLVPQGVSCVR